ncbi:MAG: glycogen/starch synthase [Muribaculaceae bacterium]|nr:glycogen/starch synthase [Muribaculaceae bacterium]
MLDLLFETSWEVCNKVGGIYAVLSTKAKTLQKRYKDNLIFIGPDLWSEDTPSPYFLEGKSPLSAWLAQAQLPEGMRVRVGRWDVPGKPVALLVTYDTLYRYKDALYTEMWNRYRVDSLHAYGDYDESCMFAYASALVIESIVKWKDNPELKIVAHFDEWTTGMGLLYLKAHLPQVATVFTTHATSIGRSICGNGKPLYDYMEGYHGDQMAGELNMQSKHSLEKAAAHAADAFTTVSNVTARECHQLLERYPLVTPNGFEQNYVPKGSKFTAMRTAARQCMLKVAACLTGQHYADDTLIVATSGRLEVRNKGIDIYLDAVASLRKSLGFVSSKRKVIALVLVPAWMKSPRADLIENLHATKPHLLFDPVITHHLHNQDCDPIYNRINMLGFHNDPKDKLTIIDVPCYLNGTDGIFNMSYYDLLPGLDAAVFPSYYEPWGYTPLESAAFGVPTITTDLAGFGQWVLDRFGDDSDRYGVKVLHRTDGNYEETYRSIAMSMMNLYVMSDKMNRAIRNANRTTSKAASWDNFIGCYDEAYSYALDKAAERNEKNINENN